MREIVVLPRNALVTLQAEPGALDVESELWSVHEYVVEQVSIWFLALRPYSRVRVRSAQSKRVELSCVWWVMKALAILFFRQSTRPPSNSSPCRCCAR